MPRHRHTRPPRTAIAPAAGKALPGLALAGMTLAGLALAGCSQPSHLDGGVNDNFGRPIAGVSVSVQDTSYKTVTDSDGRYDVPFPPGEFVLLFEKEGYKPLTYRLELAAAPKLSAEDVTLGRVPPDGLSLVQAADYLPLGKCRAQIELNENSGAKSFSVGQTGAVPIPVSGTGPRPTLVFVDGSAGGAPQPPRLFRVQTGGEFFRYDPTLWRENVQAVTANIRVIEPPVPGLGRFITVDLQDGTYVYTAMAQVASSSYVFPNEKGVCAIFTIMKAN